MSLTNPNTPVSQQDLQDFYHKLLPYMGGSFGMIANKFSKGDMYSTDEKMIGQWIDGKPLYQKTIDFGALPKNTSKSVAHNISNISTVCNIYGIGVGSIYQPFPILNDATPNKSVAIWCDNTNVTVRATNEDYSSTVGYITIQYTKTTDTAISIGDDTDYSTEEKIVGTWIDESPVYQKVVYNTTLATIPNNSWVQYCSITNLKAVISFSLIRANSDGTPSNGVFNDISGSTDGNSVKCIARASTLTLDNSKSYAIIQYTKTT